MFKQILKMKWLMCVLVCVMVIPLALGCAAEEAAPAPAEAPKPETQVWRFQGIHPAEDERHFGMTHFANIVEEMSDGLIHIDIYTTGALVPIEESLEGMTKGVIEGVQTCSGYFAGLDPVLAIGVGVWDLRTQWQVTNFYYEKGGDKIMRDAYAKFGVHYIQAVQAGSPEIVYSKVPVRHVEDFKGLKMRSFGISAEFFTELGAATIYLPGDEIVPALATGTLDAAEWSSPLSNYLIGFHEVTDYQIWPAFIGAVGGCEYLMGLDLWNNQPSNLQAIITIAAMETNAYVDRLYNTNDATYFKKMLEEGPMEEIWIPEDEWPQLVAAAERVRDKRAAASPEAAEFVRLLRAYMDELGYLPESW